MLIRSLWWLGNELHIWQKQIWKTVTSCFYWLCSTGPRVKYHVKILAFSVDGDGYQAHQTVNTPACHCKTSQFRIFIFKCGSDIIWIAYWKYRVALALDSFTYSNGFFIEVCNTILWYSIMTALKYFAKSFVSFSLNKFDHFIIKTWE